MILEINTDLSSPLKVRINTQNWIKECWCQQKSHHIGHYLSLCLDIPKWHIYAKFHGQSPSLSPVIVKMVIFMIFRFSCFPKIILTGKVSQKKFPVELHLAHSQPGLYIFLYILIYSYSYSAWSLYALIIQGKVKKVGYCIKCERNSRLTT